MDDLISRAEAIEKAKHDYDFFKGASNVSDKVRRDELLNVIFWLGNLPSVDAVPVVRCKDCAYLDEVDEHELWCMGNGYPARLVTPDEYCSKGAPK